MQKEIKLTSLYFDHVYGAEYDAVIQVGGRYSGKSYNSQIEEAANMASKESYKLLIIQELDKGSSDGYYAGLVDKIEQFEHLPAYNITTSSTKITNNINGNVALFRGYKTKQQKMDVKNIDQVTKIVVEEGDWMSYDDFLSLIQQLRGKVRKDRRLDILLNPVNEYCFVNTEIIQKPPDKVFEYFPNSNRPKVFEKIISTHYQEDGKDKSIEIKILVVLSTHYDNPHLTGVQRAAIEVYRTSDPDKYKQLGEARFIKSGGAFFKEFNRDTHVCEPFVIPDTWTRYRSIDYGLDMTAVLWHAVAPDGYVYTYKELHESDLIISEAAKRIKEVNGDDRIVATYYPADLDARQKVDGVTVHETFRKNGINLSPTSNKRIQGWLAVKEALKLNEYRNIVTGQKELKPKLITFSNCETLIKNIQIVKKSEVDPNDVANKPHELTHILDSLRYYCITRFGNYKEEAKEKKETKYDKYVDEMTRW